MGANVDPRLIELLKAAGDEGDVEAVLMLKSGQAPQASGETSDERGAGGRLLDRVSQEDQLEPSEVRFMPLLDTVFVKGSGKLIRRLLEDEGVLFASANEAEVVLDSVPQQE